MFSFRTKIWVGLLALSLFSHEALADETGNDEDELSCADTLVLLTTVAWDTYHIHRFDVVVGESAALPEPIQTHIRELVSADVAPLNLSSEYAVATGVGPSQKIYRVTAADSDHRGAGSIYSQVAAIFTKILLENPQAEPEIVLWRITAGEAIPPSYISEAIEFPLPCDEASSATIGLANLLPDGRVEVLMIPPFVRLRMRQQNEEYRREINSIRQQLTNIPARSSFGRVTSDRDSVFYLVGNAGRRLAIEEAIHRASYPEMSRSLRSQEEERAEKLRLKEALSRLPFMELAPERDWLASVYEGGTQYEGRLQSVEKPEPGDLVLYAGPGSGSLAIYLGNDRVERWVPEADNAGFIHHILDVPTSFGDKIFFLRAPPMTIE